jgi:flagellar basal-body rod protein FlgF
MIRGFYAAASGMILQLARQDGYAHNLANVNTAGFRRTRTAVARFDEDLAAALGSASPASGGVAAREVGLDLTTGPLTRTERPLDLALTGNAFFTVQTTGGPAYTRDGRFRLDDQRRLVTEQGQPVLGQNGPIVLPAGEVAVTDKGVVSCNGKPVDTLRLAEPTNPRAVGTGLYSAGQTRPATAFAVSQGMVEQSNVNAMQEMGEMLNGFRLYEANTTALRYQDDTLTTLYKVVE